MRKISEELQALVQDSLVEETLAAAFEDLGYKPTTVPSVDSVKAVRPKRPTSAAETVRELRERRHGAHLSRQ